MEAQDKYPTLLAKKVKIKIITVGSVVATNGPNHGERYTWSGGGSAATMTAPGNGDCTTASHDENQIVSPDASSATILVFGRILSLSLSRIQPPKMIDVGNSLKAVSQYVKNDVAAKIPD